MMRAVAATGRGALPVLMPVLAALLVSPAAGAEPTPTPGPAVEPSAGPIAYVIGRCYTPEQPVVEEPTRVVYNCDSTSVMQDMQWSSWGPDGASGSGTDNSVQCKPNCAEGPHLINPIVVRAWNPKPPNTPGCPKGVQFFTELTVAYPEGVPPWIVPGTRWTEGVEYTYVDGVPAVHFTDQGPYRCAALPTP